MDQEVKKLAKQYFEAYPKEDTIFITTDRQVFLTSNRGDAVNHQRHLDPKQSLLTVTRLQVSEKEVILVVEPDESWKVSDLVEYLKKHIDGFEQKGQKKDTLLELALKESAKQKAAAQPGAEQQPDATWEEQAIIEWLSGKGVDAEGTKEELLVKVAEVVAKSGAQ